MAYIEFHRRPRQLIAEPPAEPIAVKHPPTDDEPQSAGMRLAQITMPVISGLGGLVFVMMRPQLMIIIVMLIVFVATMGMSIVMGMQQGRQQKRRTARAKEKYRLYLKEKRATLDGIVAAYAARNSELFPAPEALFALTTDRSRLWERRSDNPDFLDTRVGSGRLASPTPIALEHDDGLSPREPDPELIADARTLVADYSSIDNSPLVIHLSEIGAMSIVGTKENTRHLTQWILAQTTFFQSPDDVRCVVIAPSDHVAEWESLKWLPHVRTSTETPRGDATDVFIAAAGSAAAGQLLDGLVAPRLHTDAAPGSPHIVIVFDSFQPNVRETSGASFQRLCREGAAIGVTVICLVENGHAEPSDISVRISVNDDAATVDFITATDTTHQTCTPDFLDDAMMRTVARSLAPFRLPQQRALAPITTGPQTVTLGQFLQGDSDATAILTTPIGIDGTGHPVSLDIKEIAQGGTGPHGILIGASGSGKSELLKSLVCGMVVRHDPDILSFVLVDFKGGSAFAAFENLPHTAGIITNLEGEPSNVERFRLALDGELTRRQEILKNAGRVKDIVEYQRLRTTNPDLEPLPYLLLVVDEFAELLTAHPDFDEVFEGIGRTGRSLGVFMLLATQGLQSGGLQRLERHISYRICLRTNTAQESSAVIGRPDAAQLPLVPGLGFFQRGTSEPERFTACMVSAPYSDPHRQISAPDLVRPFSTTANPDTAPISPSSTTATELDVLLSDPRIEHFDVAHQVWISPLPRILPLNAATAEITSPLATAIGLIDYPERQKQFPLILDLAGREGHVALVGAPQSGKSTFLRTLITAFTVQCSPQDINFYCVDMGGGSLEIFRDVDHVGMVAGKSDVEKIKRCVRHISALIDERDAFFREAGIGSVEEMRRYRQNYPEHNLADIVLVIDNWSAMAGLSDTFEPDVTRIASTGLSYGIHVVLTATRWAEVRSALRDRIAGKLQLHVLDSGDSIANMRASKALPQDVAGRGLLANSQNFQIAIPRVDDKATIDGIDDALRQTLTILAQRGNAAQQIRLLPHHLSATDVLALHNGTEGTALPIGMSDLNLQTVSLDILSKDTQHLLVCGEARCGKTSFLRGLLAVGTHIWNPNEVQFFVADTRRGLLDVIPESFSTRHVLTPAAIGPMVADLQQELAGRFPPETATRRDLETRSHVQGPDIILVVDDDDILQSAVFRPIVDAIPHAWDLKFHVVVARRSTNVPYDGIAAALQSNGAAGIAMSDPERSFLGTRVGSLPPGRGYVVRRGMPTQLLQLAVAN